MATNWNVREAAKAINANDKNAIIDLGRRFPLATIAIAKIKDQAALDFLQVIPEHITMRKIEQTLKGDEAEGETTEENGAEAEVEEESTTKPETTAEVKSDYDKMNRKQLKELIVNAGGEKKCREEFGWTTRDQLLAYINKYGLDPVDEGEEEVEEEATDPYEGKTAVELFKECKKRKIKAEPKKPAKFYADLLRKADDEAAKATEDEDPEDEDGWGEEEDEKPAKPAKAAKPAKSAKPAKPAKPAKKAEPEDEDDDWDI